MALADSVPGVSGGTVAFVLGFYDRFMDSIHGLVDSDGEVRKASLLYLAKLGLGWVVGMVACIFALSELFESHIYTMSSLFLGLSISAIACIAVEEKNTLKFSLVGAIMFIAGIALVVLVSEAKGSFSVLQTVDFSTTQPEHLIYLFASGAAAITAMVLPGISGSSILLAAGVYIPTIQAIRSFLTFDLSVFPGLFALGLGIIVGIIVSVNLIRNALKKNRNEMIWMVLGLTIGSLYAIVKGPVIAGLKDMPLSLGSVDYAAFLIGVASLAALEVVKRKKA